MRPWIALPAAPFTSNTSTVLVYAVVMESRGIYMSSDWKAAEPFAPQTHPSARLNCRRPRAPGKPTPLPLNAAMWRSYRSASTSSCASAPSWFAWARKRARPRPAPSATTMPTATSRIGAQRKPEDAGSRLRGGDAAGRAARSKAMTAKALSPSRHSGGAGHAYSRGRHRAGQGCTADAAAGHEEIHVAAGEG